jgi:APA family basic amino acid/polyamine antiporter
VAPEPSTNSDSASSSERSLGLWMCTALVVGNMIGSGIFLLPAALAPFGAISIAGWIATSVGALALALVFGRVARMVPKTGGPYAYTREAFGDFPGFLVAWGYWIALWAGNAAVAVAFASYVGFFFPAVAENPVVGLAVALGAIWLVTFVNLRGVGAAGLVQLFTAILKVLPLLVVGGIGLAFIEPGHFHPPNRSDLSNSAAIAACATLTLWAFLGLESATVPAGNVRRPEITIPRATVLGTCIAAGVYILVTVAAIGLVPPEVLETSTAPLALAAQTFLGGWGGILVALGAIVSTFGTLNGFTLLTGQVPYGAARDGVFPALFGRLSGRGTPAVALVISNILASGLIAMNFTKGLVEQFTFIILLATLTTLVPYVFCALSEVVLRLRAGPGERPGAATVLLGLLAFVYSAWAIYGAGEEVVYYGFLLLIAGFPVYVWTKGFNSEASGEALEEP